MVKVEIQLAMETKWKVLMRKWRVRQLAIQLKVKNQLCSIADEKISCDLLYISFLDYPSFKKDF